MFTGIWFIAWLFSSSPSFSASDLGNWGTSLIIVLLADFILTLLSEIDS